MITIYHGGDTAKSRKSFIDEKLAYSDAVSLSGAKITLTEILQLFEGNDLFATEKHIFIEDFFTAKKQSKEMEDIVTVINNHQKDVLIYFWEGKDLSAKQLKQFPQALAKHYKVPQTVFAFLDAIKPHAQQQAISLFHTTLADQEASFLFAMLIRQFRILLAIKEPTNESIDEVKRIAPWQREKLSRQANLFSIPSLLEHYAKLYELEKASKTGNLSMPLEQAIDFFLLQL